MSNGINISCRKVYDSGKEYIEYHDEIINIQKELNEIATNINNIWYEEEGNSFTTSFKKHIKDLNLIISFLDSNGNLLKNNSEKHSSIDDKFVLEVERSDIEDE